jgi:uroporphyrinogen decarboxylase
MNKRDIMLSFADGTAPQGNIPSAFFLHFGSQYQQGQAAIDRHLEFFHFTGMDFVKVQYEQDLSPVEPIHDPKGWLNAPAIPEEAFEPTVNVVKGLVDAAKGEALVVLTVYSPLMWAVRMSRGSNLFDQLKENPGAVQTGLETMTENVITLLKACKRAGVDGFYVSTQGGEMFRFPGTDFFTRYVKPTDLAVWDAISDCPFNILHICDYEGPYNELSPFIDYPGHVVNCSLKVGDRTLTTKEAAQMFKRPFMGGMERKGVLASGSQEQIRQEANKVLAGAPERFILAADCTVPAETPWENLKTAITTAHQYSREN